MGLHASYETFNTPEKLLFEAETARQILGRNRIGGRQHYLRWCPETWLHWEACGLAYDSTLGFADQVGFRAGTCFPYRPWVISENREVDLIEIPLIVMDCTPYMYMGLTPDDCLRTTDECITRCKIVGGVFTLLWHNTSAVNPPYSRLYVPIMTKLLGADRFDWASPSTDLG
jgi:hypothetical protein